ncbi:hypothetical protein AYM40_07635 [Paraburkholderia phytofirmans OLGA172]|uniref:Uncharacterized protein n=1 Tax=Paraburkholderia phytofirmans OLGA172 TaxID=1417228 RepID=A0A160FJU3_9BURK|nr:hypothetical protein AYM40_07635 [Paraburkholderia phytofirmans OLGA172]
MHGDAIRLMSKLRRGVATIDVRMLGTGGFAVARAVQQRIFKLDIASREPWPEGSIAPCRVRWAEELPHPRREEL